MPGPRVSAKTDPLPPPAEPIGPGEDAAAEHACAPASPASVPSPELLAWQQFLRANWLLNSLTQNFMEPLVQFETLPARLNEVERDLAEGRIPADRLSLVEEELRTTQLWFADVAEAIEDTDRAIQRLLTAVWERRKAIRGGVRGR